MKTSGTTNDNEWQQAVQRPTATGTASDNKWLQVTTNDNE